MKATERSLRQDVKFERMMMDEALKEKARWLGDDAMEREYQNQYLDARDNYRNYQERMNLLVQKRLFEESQLSLFGGGND